MFDHEPGFHQTCPICGWEDSLLQLRFPQIPGSGNSVTLQQAQKNFAEFGAAERKNRGCTREPMPEEKRDAEWRPLDPERDNPEQPRRGVDYMESYPHQDMTVLYYWRATYWRKLDS